MAEPRRWAVTYTKHIHQKRKVYQDGVLETKSNKVMLYDDSNEPLGSRFLKKDEKIECGSTLILDSHLVDIGEPEGKHKPLTNLDTNSKDKKSNEKMAEKEPISRHKSSFGGKRTMLHNSFTTTHQPDTTQNSMREWNALYTTQITQKAKKYQDGILRLEECGSHMNQVILFDEDGSVLGSNHLKSAECVKSGINYQLPGYLIQICEPRNLQREESKKNNLMEEGIARTTKTTTSGRALRNKCLHNENLKKINLAKEVVSPGISEDSNIPSSIGSTRKDFKQSNFLEEVAAGSSSEVNQFSVEVGVIGSMPFYDENYKEKNLMMGLTNSSNSSPSHKIPGKPLRDAFQILSKFKKTLPGESLRSRESTAKQFHTSKILMPLPADVEFSSDKVLLHSVPDGKCLKTSPEVSHKGSPQEPLIQNAILGNVCSKSNASQEVISVNSNHREGPSLDHSVALADHSFGLLSSEERERSHCAWSNSVKESTSVDDSGGGDKKLITDFVKDEVSNKVEICRKITADGRSDIADERFELSSTVLPGLMCSPCKALNVTVEASEERCNISKKAYEFPSFDLGI